ncbi:MAG: 23S rRNA (adenine(2503)-C(2))-methyltransferase RlmN [Planctomycetales bacterium]|jgi:23S rRNA (adenine2503-C2)-methyltransferase|nr:23S rRNA (adenine(2503)-C(2))-methyltransferase RlmN [Planctomycetales bacterium]
MSRRIGVFDRSGIESLRKELRIDPHSVRQLRNDLFKHFLSDEDALSRFSAADRVAVHSLEMYHRRDSMFDGATKLLLKTAAGMLIESVILRVASGRTTLCVSSQIGCAAACDFCATGKMGIARNLAAAEILDQLLIAGQLLRTEKRSVRNVVFMGMGEPFHNEENLYQSLESLISQDLFHHSPTKVLISTVGIADAMIRCAKRFPKVNLALSLHSVRQDVREQLIPLARLYRLKQLRETVIEINALTGSPVMIEYLMLAGRNDSETDARELIEWVSGMSVHVNLIPYNPIDESPHLHGSDRPTREAFASRLKNEGIKTTLRYSLGHDIAAACGQLVRHENRHPPTVIQ